MEAVEQTSATQTGWLRSRTFDFTFVQGVAMVAVLSGVVVVSRPDLFKWVLMADLVLLGYHGLDFLSQNEGLTILAELGVILLLFEVGLESNVKEMISVGASSLLVAVLGVVAPFFLGWGVSAWLLPEYDTLVHVFVGATLCATSVGITARVLGDLGSLAIGGGFPARQYLLFFQYISLVHHNSRPGGV